MLAMKRGHSDANAARPLLPKSPIPSFSAHPLSSLPEKHARRRRVRANLSENSLFAPSAAWCGCRIADDGDGKFVFPWKVPMCIISKGLLKGGPGQTEA